VLVAMSRVMPVVKRGIICSGANMIITKEVEGSYPLVRAGCSLCFTYRCQLPATHLFVWHVTERLLSELCTSNQEINVSTEHV